MSTQVCKATGIEFSLTPEEREWYDRFQLPYADIVKEERLRRKLAFLNTHKFFWRKSQTGERLFSVFSPHSPLAVEPLHEWLKQDLRSAHFDFITRRPFFEQLHEAWKAIPRPHIFLVGCEDVSICTNSYGLRHCYEVSDSADSSRCLYSVALQNCEDCVDTFMLTGCRSCYECIDCKDLQNSAWCRHSERLTDCRFMLNCFDCKDCLFCWNLKGKQFCVFNKQVSEEEYHATRERWNLATRPTLDEALNQYFDKVRAAVFPHVVGSLEIEPSTTGNYIRASSKVAASFGITGSDSVYGCLFANTLDDCLDVCHSLGGLKHSAQAVAVGGKGERIFNCYSCWGDISDLEYSAYCTDSRHLFGCLGLHGREYCIGNQQYSQGEYETVMKDIVAWLTRKRVYRKFFPSGFSDFAYNHSAAQDFFPINKYQSEMLGYNWDDGEEGLKPSQLLQGAHGRIGELPLTLDELDRSILATELFLCQWSGRPYQILPVEHDFYTRMRISPPTKCFDERHRERLALLSPLKLFERELSGAGLVTTSFVTPSKPPLTGFDAWRAALD